MTTYTHKCYNCKKPCTNIYCSTKCMDEYHNKETERLNKQYPHLNIAHNVNELQQLILQKAKQKKQIVLNKKYSNIPMPQVQILQEIFS